MNTLSLRSSIRAIALSVFFSGSGLLAAFVIKKVLAGGASKLTLSAIAFIVTSGCVLGLFPGVLGIPFGRVTVGEFARRVGLVIPRRAAGHVLLGVAAAALTLTGMLVGSYATGKYSFTWSTVTLGQAAFSLTPALWEEVLYRGVIVVVLLRVTGSLTRACLIQIAIFGVAHVKGLDALSLVDAFSVAILAVAFTVMAVRTRCLLAGIVFHYLHDTFLFAVQLPGGEYSGLRDNALFYASLWAATGLVIAATALLTARLRSAGDPDPYSLEGRPEGSVTPLEA